MHHWKPDDRLRFEFKPLEIIVDIDSFPIVRLEAKKKEFIFTVQPLLDKLRIKRRRTETNFSSVSSHGENDIFSSGCEDSKFIENSIFGHFFGRCTNSNLSSGSRVFYDFN